MTTEQAEIPASTGMRALGQRALDVVGARLAVLFFAAAFIGILIVGMGHLRWMVTTNLIVGTAAILLALALIRRNGTTQLAIALTAAAIAAGIASGGLNVAGEVRSHTIASWLVGGVAGGVAAARGPRWGLISLLATAGASLSVEHWMGGPAPAVNFLGALAYYLGSSAVHIVARRSYAATEYALAAAEEAAAAQQVAEERWRARRQADRWLHDEVLATLTILSHRGVGLPNQLIQENCARDAENLQRGYVPAKIHSQAVVEPSVAILSGTTREALEATLKYASKLDLQIRFHEKGDHWSHAPLNHNTMAALQTAMAEIVTNAHKYAEVRTLDVAGVVRGSRLTIFMVDEGVGFSPTHVPADRLGLRASVKERLREVGGNAMIWSKPGQGTTIVLQVPLSDPAALSRQTPSSHHHRT